jgi:hypothetical protein
MKKSQITKKPEPLPDHLQELKETRGAALDLIASMQRTVDIIDEEISRLEKSRA